MTTTTTTIGGAREGAGRKSVFPGKILNKSFSMAFTPQGLDALDAIAARTGLSRNDVISHLASKYVATLTFSTDGVVFPGKSPKVLAIRLDKTVGRAVSAARKRTGKSYSDIGEALVLWHGRGERFPVLPGADRRVRRPRRK